MSQPSVSDPQDAINELMKCVLCSLLPDQVLNHPVAEGGTGPCQSRLATLASISVFLKLYEEH